MIVGLVGNPNCGKTTLFNALTGARQHVGNWPGVTVEKKSGSFALQNSTVEVVDLPGTYSLITASDTASIDEKIACEFVLNNQADIIVNIVDASHLERNLYLTLQLIEMQVPMIVVLNMIDIASQQQINISVDVLSQQLGCPVIAVSAHLGNGVEGLKKLILKSQTTAALPKWQAKTGLLEKTIQAVAQDIKSYLPAAYQHCSTWVAMRLLEEDVFVQQLVSQDALSLVSRYQSQLRAELSEDADILLADARYQQIQKILSLSVLQPTERRVSWTERLDRVVLNRVLGIPIFLGMMYAMFFFAINVGGAFQDFFDIGSDTLFVTGLGQSLTYLGFPNWLVALLANGVGRGVNTTLTFIPVIGAMFLFLAFLEDSGYMARAAFVVDRLMRALGLPGKSFVPMIVGFGCNVPAVMATRTLDNKRDRILTVMMSPFMSCGARLAIYAVFTAAFFPVGGQNIVFALYLIGIGMAMLTGLLLRKTVLQGEPSPLVLELPLYHAPRLKTLFIHAWQRLKGFVLRAGKLIVPICVLIGAMAALNPDGSVNNGEANSLLSHVGRLLTPIFAPMGIHQDNWPATVGLLTGVLAKEVVIGTLNELYSQIGHVSTLHASGLSVWDGLHSALLSIPHNLSLLSSSFGNPILAEAPVHTLTQDIYGLMYQRFDGQIGAFAYLLFVLLYFPCVSTTAAMLREVSRGWTLFSVCWTTGVAYGTAVLFYQTATFARHPQASLCWILSIVAVLGLVIRGIQFYVKPLKKLTLLPSGELV